MDRKELYQSIAKRRTEYGIVHSRTAMDDFMILKRWAEGHTIERIAEKFPCSVSKVNTALRRMRIFANSERYDPVGLPEVYGMSNALAWGKIPLGRDAAKIFRILLGQRQRGYNHFYLRDVQSFMPNMRNCRGKILDELNGLIVTTWELPRQKVRIFESVVYKEKKFIAQWTEAALPYILW